MYVAPNNRLSNHFRKKKTENPIWIDDQSVSGSFYQNRETMREKTKNQMFYEEHMTPFFSFSNNHSPTNVFGDSYPSSMQTATPFEMNLLNGDGLSDWQEAANYGTSWNDPDCDDDGLKDGEEINTYGTDPKDFDTDNDRILDGSNQTLDVDYGWRDERKCEMDWTDAGIYHVDGVWLGELSYGTNANDSDTDNDDMPDGWEAYYGTKPTIADANEDYDYDNLTNIQEYLNKTNPTNPDTDFDYLNDFAELEMGLDPLGSDYDNDWVLDGLDLQPKARWDVEWKPYYMPGGTENNYYTQEFAVLTNRHVQPSNDDIKKAIKEQYKGEITVKSIQYLRESGIPSEIEKHKDLIDVADAPKWEYRFNITWSAKTNFSYMKFDWVLEPNADQRIAIQFSMSPGVWGVNSTFGFMVDVFDEGKSLPISSFFASANSLEDNRSYQINVHIPWSCVSNDVKNVSVGLRPVLLEAKLAENKTSGNVDLTNVTRLPVNATEHNIVIGSVTGIIIKDPYLIAVRPDTDPALVKESLPWDILNFKPGDMSYFYKGYQFDEKYLPDENYLSGPVCVKNVNNVSTGELVAFVVVGRMLSDVMYFANESLYKWTYISGLPLLNRTVSYKVAYLYVKKLVYADTKDVIPMVGSPETFQVLNNTIMISRNAKFNDIWYYEAEETNITSSDWNLECLETVEMTLGVSLDVITKTVERSSNVEGITLIQCHGWATTKIINVLKGADVFVIAVITNYRVTIAIEHEDYWEATVYSISGSVLITGVIFDKVTITILGPELGAWGGISLIIATVIIDAYYLGKAYYTNDPAAREYFIGQAITFTADMVDVAIAMYVWFGPIPVGAIAEGICFGITFILWRLGILDRPYGIVGSIVQIIFKVGGVDLDKIVVDAVKGAFDSWKENREAEGLGTLLVTIERPWWVYVTIPFWVWLLSDILGG